ncbi:MAG: hypothetical protein COU98_01425 [Candidatus Staskawiczbacteria bacterium CG10_big_fil_rev_8_21_14_0_10_38_10]|uniref:Uncharacterized protein n=1 Tax=Candidatus Staskawiczbacteria bacterium CG10_big_fil_rev_8_21_14_0_10_38_10 TaxID=1974891 RepID=A0A2H9T1J9_9BACT|nr:MAG: hypothetical protein COU98_01425 [Candidatus Staskawiczbacteria bacterium CG10_big_fil_rev_8_21_14_0_10_38_10]
MFFLLGVFWFTRTAKNLLFWIYLWQLKEYHIGRFLDHFRTQKGKSLLLNPLQIYKLFFIGLFIVGVSQKWVSPVFILILVLFLVYFIESLVFFNGISGKRVKIPTLTVKTSILISAGMIILVLFPLITFWIFRDIFWYTVALLVFDIFCPVIVSFIVLFFQPFAFLMKKRVLKRAKLKREEFKKLLVIGITGSYGKTSTKEFLATILSQKFSVLKTKEHINAEIGIAQTILKELKHEHQIFITEIGAYEKGKIKEVCEMLQPKFGVLTGINEQHMATFGSQNNIVAGKYELIRSLPQNGAAFFNGDNEFCQKLYEKTDEKKKIVFSTPGRSSKIIETPDLLASDILVEKESVSFKVISKDGDKAGFKLNLLGAQNIENILLAAVVAKELGMSLEEIAKTCQRVKPDEGGMKLKKGISDVNIIDSTYSSNPNGVISHLEYLKIWPGRKIIIMPCLIELGKASKEVHKRIGKKIAEVCDLAIITTEDRFEDIESGAIKAGKKKNILLMENPLEILEKIKSFCQPTDVILLEGRLPKQLINLLVS